MSKRLLASILFLLLAAILVSATVYWRPPHPEALAQDEQMEPVTLDPEDPSAHWPQRYRSNPLLLVTEAYALDTLGELPPRMQALVPKLVSRTFGKHTFEMHLFGMHFGGIHFGNNDDWKSLVRERLGWPSDMDQQIRERWARFQSVAESAGTPSNSLDFAQQFADEMDKKQNPAKGGR